MLKDAEVEGNTMNDFVKEQAMDVENLPKLFNYGLEFFKTNQLEA